MQSFSSNVVLNLFNEFTNYQQILLYVFINTFCAVVLYYFVECLIVKKTLSKYKLSNSVIALACSLVSVCLLLNYNPMNSNIDNNLNGDLIELRALSQKNENAEGTEIWIKNIEVDGKIYSPNSILTEGWISNGNLVGWREFDRPAELNDVGRGIVPYGSKRSIILESNKWRGKVEISFLEQNFIVDCYNNVENGEIKIDLEPNLATVNTKSNGDYFKYIGIWIVALGALIISAFNLYIKLPETKQKNIDINNRKIYLDVLRIFCIFNVVLLHGTVNGFESSFNQPTIWNGFLYVNCFVACAVPMFFMLSGSLNIRKTDEIVKPLMRRIIKIVVPLFCWSILYILLRKYHFNEDINVIKQIIKIMSEPQWYHLWFIYTLLGLYLLNPIISYCYYHFPKNLMIYICVVFGCIPLILNSIQNLTDYSINIPFLKIFYPEVILFVLGKVILDNKEYFYKNRFVWYLTAFIGYSGVVLLTYYFSIKYNMPYKNFFSNYGLTSIFIMYTSFFILFCCMEEKFDKISIKFKRILITISNASMNIYFLHMFIYELLKDKNFFGLFSFTHLSTDLYIALITSIVCFLISLLCVLVINIFVNRMRSLKSKLIQENGCI